MAKHSAGAMLVTQAVGIALYVGVLVVWSALGDGPFTCSIYQNHFWC